MVKKYSFSRRSSFVTMPSNLLKLSSSSSMDSEFHSRGDFERSGSFDSEGSHNSRSRSAHLDNENLRDLTNEEKNVLMFFEETLDAFEDDTDEPPKSRNSSVGYYSPRSLEDSHSDSDDIIDLVQTDHHHVGVSPDYDSGPNTNGKHYQYDSRISEPTNSASAPVPIPSSRAQKDERRFSPEPPSDHIKLLGAVPTPVVIAQKISEKKTELAHLASPQEEKSPEPKRSIATSPISDDHFVFPSPPNGKLNRFPNNISVKQGGKQYNKTIAKASVNVQERKAQVLAHLHVPGLLGEEIDGKNGKPLIRKTSFRDMISEQTRYEALTKLGLVKEIPVQADIHSSPCTSPVSNSQHSSNFFPSELHRRLSNERVSANGQHSTKSLHLDSNKKNPYEQNYNSSQNLSKFPVDTRRKLSKEQDHTDAQLPTKIVSEESNRRLSTEQNFNSGQNPSRFSMEIKRRLSKEQDDNAQNTQNRSQNLSKFPVDTTRKLSKEKDNIDSQLPPKIVSEESNRRLFTEQNFNSGQNPSRFSLEIKRRFSKEQDDNNAQHTQKVMPEVHKKLSNEPESISNILMNDPSPFIPLGKSVVIKGETVSNPIDKSKRHSTVYSNREQKQPNTQQEIKRTSSIPRPTGLRPQGITVQFSGRNEENRKDALRKLGLLKESGQ
ncbi:uncharacterized protein [Hyperolius riggenbachi]|uniref:proline and serine-rich protein 2 n=1 Tax=Hyperolius riggenbachi TaxID=752182 RepID=UPI0035A34A39